LEREHAEQRLSLAAVVSDVVCGTLLENSPREASPRRCLEHQYGDTSQKFGFPYNEVNTPDAVLVGPPRCDGSNTAIQAKRYLELLSDWLSITTMPWTTQGLVILLHAEGDLRSTIHRLSFETVSSEDGGEQVWEHLRINFADHLDDKFSTRRCDEPFTTHPCGPPAQFSDYEVDEYATVLP
jgi:hypothetical protein